MSSALACGPPCAKIACSSGLVGGQRASIDLILDQRVDPAFHVLGSRRAVLPDEAVEAMRSSILERGENWACKPQREEILLCQSRLKLLDTDTQRI